MKVIKNINNNVSICVDDDNNELIAFGRGIGYKTPPYEIEDLSVIQRTYYDVEPRYLDLFNLIPLEIFDVSANIVDYARIKIDALFNSNIVFTLADHIQFAIQRFNQKMDMKFMMHYELENLYELEVKIGEYALEAISKKLKIDLPQDEVYSIALHFINAESITTSNNGSENKKLIEDIILIIEKQFNVHIDRKGFNYSRFSSHMEYLLKRCVEGTSINSENFNIFNTVKSEYPQTYICAELISDYLNEKLKCSLSNEELLYLMLHANRLCARADCYQ